MLAFYKVDLCGLDAIYLGLLEGFLFVGIEPGMVATGYGQHKHTQINSLIDVDYKRSLTPNKAENSKDRGSIFYTIMNVF